MDIQAGEILLVSDNSHTNMNEEFEHLDEEFEALIRERVLVNETETHARCNSTTFDATPTVLNLGCIRNAVRNYSLEQEDPNLTQTLPARSPLVALNSKMDQNSSDLTIPRCSNAISSPQQDTIELHLDLVPISCDREDVASMQAEEHDVEWNEFCNLIDKMIQQLP